MLNNEDMVVDPVFIKYITTLTSTSQVILQMA